jgi:hypothetical protein
MECQSPPGAEARLGRHGPRAGQHLAAEQPDSRGLGARLPCRAVERALAVGPSQQLVNLLDHHGPFADG